MFPILQLQANGFFVLQKGLLFEVEYKHYLKFLNRFINVWIFTLLLKLFVDVRKEISGTNRFMQLLAGTLYYVTLSL